MRDLEKRNQKAREALKKRHSNVKNQLIQIFYGITFGMNAIEHVLIPIDLFPQNHSISVSFKLNILYHSADH